MKLYFWAGLKKMKKIKEYADKTGAKYFGTFPLKTFIGLMDKCEIIITVVTMALHIAIGLKKKIVLLNNIFNSHEFELYDRGEIIEPERECKCYFKTNMY